MKTKIIQKANDMFLNLGFKSVTMDDLAFEMGISKKTIYTHFQNKTKLVAETMDYLFENICAGIDTIIAEQHEPIKELFMIKAFVMQNLKNEKTAPQYQLQKYYPKIYEGLKCRQFDVMQDTVCENIKRGIEKNIYRTDIDISTIARLYFIGINAIKDQELFPMEQFPVSKLMKDYLAYHVRGIATEKGHTLLEHILKES